MVTGLEGRSKLLFGKFGGGGVVTSAAKEAAWAEICDNMRAVSGIQRSVTEVKKKWCGVKRFVDGVLLKHIRLTKLTYFSETAIKMFLPVLNSNGIIIH